MARGADLTLTAVRRQIVAMGGDQFEIGVRDQTTGRMLLRQWSSTELIKAVPWLRHQNYVDGDVYIRPDGPSGLVLMDDITLGTIKRLEEAGLEPAAVVLTSPMNYQAWIRLSNNPIPNPIRTVTARTLAIGYEADRASADWRHFGRLAGFTNRKPKHRDDNGRAPFVLLYSASGRTASLGEQFVGNLEIPEERKPISSGSQCAENKFSNDDAIRYFNESLQDIKERYGTEYDASRGDWMISQSMARLGYSREQIRAALESSPDIYERKKGHVDDYIQRTLSKIISPEP